MIQPSIAQELVNPVAFFPAAIFSVIGAIYFISLGYAQIERGRWLGLLPFLGGALLAVFGAFSVIVGPILLQMALKAYRMVVGS